MERVGVVGVVGVGLVGALRALVGVVGAVVAVGCRCAPAVVVGGQELVLHQQKNLFLWTDRARFRTNSVSSLRLVLPDLPCLLCLSFLASGARGHPTFPPQRPTRLLPPHPLLVPPPCIHPLILSSTGLLATPCRWARPATISATLTPLGT